MTYWKGVDGTGIGLTEGTIRGILEVCHPRCVCENWKGYVVKHNSGN